MLLIIVLQNPDYMKENFSLAIETMHLSDRGDTKNVSELWIIFVFIL